MGNYIFSRPFNPKTDRHDTALVTLYCPHPFMKLVGLCVGKGIREAMYDIIGDFEKREGRAPYGVEVALIYLKHKAWFSRI